ncbi:DUF2384 domain-containing protein [Massilia violaceinigra]|uniref:DUF2384 domain-containing protein n=1 Tax=Massilia violaceinigra TaxID=2045208 RepID=A0ABY4A306_9BURK|nr:antitoxin Xre/MbcA/ParS toxin-binding domain-containing protein [Massilia violaceinigra]UOD29148.1 DUF2384 domain-containing protein [Massilia violaceinigra]
MNIKDSGKPAHDEKNANPSSTMALEINSGASGDKANGLPQNGVAHLVADMRLGQHRGIDSIRHGYPVTLLNDAAVYLDVPVERIRSLVCVPGLSAQTLTTRSANLDTTASERLWRLAHVIAMAQDLFEDDESAKTWLRSANLAFGNVAPMDYLDTEPGAMAVRQVLNAIATGGVA